MNTFFAKILKFLFSIFFRKRREQQHAITTIRALSDELPYIFQYLEVHDLLKAAQVCTVWRDFAARPSLWRTVRLKNCRITDFEGLANTLQKRSTRNLDLRNALITNRKWEVYEEFFSVLRRVNSLIKVELGWCPSAYIKAVVKSCPQLKVLNAMSLNEDMMECTDFESIGNLKQLQELRLGTKWLNVLQPDFELDITFLPNLIHLRHLSLVLFHDLEPKNIDIVQRLTKLETLELEIILSLDQNVITDVLLKLKQLKRLRLGFYVDYNMCDILQAVSKLENLSQLELEEVKIGKNTIKDFNKYLIYCKNIKRLVIVPHRLKDFVFYLPEILETMGKLSTTLIHLVIGISLNVTQVEIFYDSNKENNKECSSVLKSSRYFQLLQDIGEKISNFLSNCNIKQLNSRYLQAHFLSQLQKLLLITLPKTRITIVKIPGVCRMKLEEIPPMFLRDE